MFRAIQDMRLPRGRSVPKPRVAIAGGTGGVGLAIVDGILARQNWEPIILARKRNPALEAEIDVPILEVDYKDQGQLERVLYEHNVDTIISALNGSSESCFEAQAALIHAAGNCECVKRFAPSEFVVDYADTVIKLPHADAKLRARNHLKMHPQLETTLFQCGHFMDYFGHPRYPESHIGRYYFVLDPENCTAAIPGDGLAKGVFTLTKDVGRFVAAALELKQWPERSVMVGDRANWSQMLDIAQRARGGEIFRVARDKLQTLAEGKIHDAQTLDLVRDEARAQFALGFASGDFDLYIRGKTLNELCPDVVPIGVERFLADIWKGT